MDYALQGEFVEDGKQVVVVDLQRHVAPPDSPTVPGTRGSSEVAGGKEPPRAPRA
jgi:hypothetical protein